MPDTQPIGDNEALLRRYFREPAKEHFINGRISPSVFYKGPTPDPDCSVFIESFMSHCREWCDGKRVPSGMGIVSIYALVPREMGAEVVHTPTKRVFSHASIRNLSPVICARLADICEIRDVAPS